MESSQNKKRKVALITGITGMDGSYLTELLLSKGYQVHGIVRRASTFNRGRIEHLYNYEDKGDLILHYGDLTDNFSLINVFNKVKPDEIYNLAAQSHVAVSFDTPQYTGQVDALGVLNVLEAVRVLGLKSKVYQASTSELFSGDPKQAPQNEETPFNPKSPYGVAKLYGYNIARIYRESYGMFICNGILFNHESPRRGENFVTKKITLGIRDILLGKVKKIKLGNLDAQRDWGYAKEYVEAMWKILQQDKPEDFVIATGETHSDKEFLQEAFKNAGLDWEKHIEIDERFIRPNEVWKLQGNPLKARLKLKWKPKVGFKELVKIMCEDDFGHLIKKQNEVSSK